MVRGVVSVALMGLAILMQLSEPVLASRSCNCQNPNTITCANGATKPACEVADGRIVFGSSSNGNCDTCTIDNDDDSLNGFLSRCIQDGAAASCSGPSRKAKREHEKRSCADGNICQCFDLNDNLLGAGTYDACEATAGGRFFNVDNNPTCWSSSDAFDANFGKSCLNLANTNSARCNPGQAPQC